MENSEDYRDYNEMLAYEQFMPFGKYKGQRIIEIKDPSYLKWFKSTEHYQKRSKHFKKAVKESIRICENN